MLDELIVKNLGVIERAEFRPQRGLVVITGETGAGKTLLLGRPTASDRRGGRPGGGRSLRR